MGTPAVPMEIERKFLVRKLPVNLNSYPSHKITQAYLCQTPVIRIRKWDNEYTLTYKSGGLLSHKEIEAPLDEASFYHLLSKADGTVIMKTRYIITSDSSHPADSVSDGPADREFEPVIELDVFGGELSGFIMVEVEFPSEEKAASYTAPGWFGKEVTYDPSCHNVNMINLNEEDRSAFLSEYGHKNN